MDQSEDQDHGDLRYFKAGPPGSESAGQLAAARLLELKQAILSVVDQAAELSQEERTIAVAEALLERELFTDGWCARCQATAEGMCTDHDAGSTLADETLRHAYRRLPGSPDVQA